MAEVMSTIDSASGQDARMQNTGLSLSKVEVVSRLIFANSSNDKSHTCLCNHNTAMHIQASWHHVVKPEISTER
eukprot:13396049-Alexandrium_andersonii.AAC.1